ncbi:MAG: DUF2779 domain-containing protein [Gammaproteobacteria bacterium]|nr:DUF2779 domain-containing protein [Pseudomonadales bacterium]MCP5349271.1 DUF2779 domain-containing protein [Pseudomonadales bacterium]
MSDNDTNSGTLSKGRILAWKQCSKRLFLEVYRPELAVEDEQTAYWFAMGREVGRVARSLEPGGVLIGGGGERTVQRSGNEGRGVSPDLSSALEQTRLLLAVPGGPALFEATFQYDDVLIRADMVIPSETGLVLREVKSASRVKDRHLDDCAVQNWVMAGAGYRPDRVELAHVDTSFEYREPDNYEGLLACRDITQLVSVISRDVPDWVRGAKQTLNGPEPTVTPGLQCTDPYDCPFIAHCWQDVPDYPVSSLPDKGRIVDELLARGIEDIRDIPAGALTRPLQQRVRQVTIDGNPFVDPEAGKRLKALPYPRFYLDFETVQFAVPAWLETHPYDQLPFQWSCHIEREPGKLEQADFLDTSGEAPMRGFSEQLLTILGQQGPVFTYSNFERRIIKEQARRFPELEAQLFALLDRLVDLQKIVRQSYYHPAMKGSWSIKAVLPTIAPELDYGQLEEVKDGTGAQMAYKACIASGIGEDRRQQLEKRLREYCRMDTLAMVKVAWYFQGHRQLG